MSERPGELVLKVPHERLVADFRRIARHMSEAAAQGVTLQIGSMISAIFKAADEVYWEDSSGVAGLAWELLEASIADALVELAHTQPPTVISDEDADAILDRLGREAVDNAIDLTVLFEAPWSLGPVRAAKLTLLEWLAPPADPKLGLRNVQDLPNLARRFDEAIVLGLHREWSEQPRHYEPLLELKDDPTLVAWRELQDWKLYREHIKAMFAVAPVFGESFALKDVYIPLRAARLPPQPPSRSSSYAGRRHASQPEPDLAHESDHAYKEPKRHVLELDKAFEAWLEDPKGAKVRLVTGDPGSGKSSFLKCLAHKVAMRQQGQEDWQVLFFRLHSQHFRLDGHDIEGAIQRYEDMGIFHTSPLKRPVEGASVRLLLLFDGLDELALSGTHVSRDLARDLVTAVNQLVVNQSHSRVIRAVISGRTSVMKEISATLSQIPREQVFEVLPYVLSENERTDKFTEPHGLVASDQRPDAWRKYATVLGLNAAPPAYMLEEQFEGLTRQPLFAAFMVMGRTRLGELNLQTANRADVYDALFCAMFDRELAEEKPAFQVFRKRNEDPRDDVDRTRIQGRFFQALEALALATFRHGNLRTAPEDTVYKALEDEKCLDLFSGLRGGVAALAATFFTQVARGGGVEFGHRSFSEYLYVRRLGRWVEEAATEIEKSPRTEDSYFKEWLDLASDNRMSYQVMNLLMEELERRRNNWKLERDPHETLRPLLERAVKNGWSDGDKYDLRTIERRSVNAEGAMFCTWRSLWQPVNDEERWSFLNNDHEALISFWHRQAAADNFRQLSARSIRPLSYINLSNKSLTRSVLAFADLEHSNLAWVIALQVNLTGANLMGADLTDAALIDANLAGADLADANLAGADLTDANVTGSDLSGATLTNVNLIGANLRGANLADANLADAKLTDANLADVDLSDATLTNVSLIGANLRGANLRGANLKDANLTDANLADADLSGATLANVIGLPNNLKPNEH